MPQLPPWSGVAAEARVRQSTEGSERRPTGIIAHHPEIRAQRKRAAHSRLLASAWFHLERLLFRAKEEPGWQPRIEQPTPTAEVCGMNAMLEKHGTSSFSFFWVVRYCDL